MDPSRKVKTESWPSWTRIASCVAYGIGLAFLYSVWAVLITVFGRGAETLASIGISLKQLIASYLGGGAIGGAVVGLAWPVTRWRLGAGVVGYVAAIPAFAMISKGLVNAREPGAFWFVVLIGSLVGFFAAMWIWSDERRQRQRPGPP